jgi:hypothetical protein
MAIAAPAETLRPAAGNVSERPSAEPNAVMVAMIAMPTSAPDMTAVQSM